MQEAENKEINDVIPDNDHDSCLALRKPKILQAIDHIKAIRQKCTDIFDYINKNAASNINKNAIENFISQLTKQKIIINKKTRRDVILLVSLIAVKLFPKKSLNFQ